MPLEEVQKFVWNYEENWFTSDWETCWVWTEKNGKSAPGTTFTCRPRAQMHQVWALLAHPYKGYLVLYIVALDFSGLSSENNKCISPGIVFR